MCVCVCVYAHSSYIIPFENRKHDLPSVIISFSCSRSVGRSFARSFFFGGEKRDERGNSRREESVHAHTVFLDEEKEKARGENSDVNSTSSSAKRVVRLHYQFLC